MENNSPNLLKSTMTYGAILGTSLLGYTLILYVANLLFNKPLGILSYAIMIAGVYLAIKTFRDQSEQKAIKYGRAFGVGVLTVLFASVIVSFFTYILYKIIDPSLMQKAIDMTQEALVAQGQSDAQIEMAMKMTSKLMTAGWMSFFLILGYGFWGTVISLIVAAFLKKEPSIFNTSENSQQA